MLENYTPAGKQPGYVERTCAGGHVVTNDEIVGMTMTGLGGTIELWCVDHNVAFDNRLLSIGSVPIQM